MRRKKGKGKIKNFLIILTIIALLVTIVDISMRLVTANKQLNDLYVRQEQLDNKINRIDHTYATLFAKHQERLNNIENEQIEEVQQEENTYYEEETSFDWNLDTDTLWTTSVLAGVGALLTKGKLIREF